MSPAEARCGIVGQWLALEAGDEADSARMAAAGAHVFQKLRTHLGGVLGDNGVDSIFARSIKISSAELPFLSARPGATIDAPWGILAGHEPAVVRSACETLFTTFVGLLVAMIGEGLTWRLLHEIWPPGSADESAAQKEMP